MEQPEQQRLPGLGSGSQMQSLPVKKQQSVISGPPLDTAVGCRIDEMVWQWAAQRPDAPAVRWLGQDLTYRQLVERADQIAGALADAGVGAGKVVAVQLPRCFDLVCVLLAVLRLGGIYTAMPLDWPIARRREVLTLTGARLCVSNDADAFESAPPMVSVERLLSSPPVVIADREARPVADPASADLSSACCIFFTSGSTGVPKSAVAPHRGVIRVAKDPEAGFGPASVMLQSSSMAWDLFAVELWAPLLNGGTTLLRASERFSYDDLRDAVKAGANTACLTPTLFNGAVSDDPESLRGLETIFIGGERASAEHVRSFLRSYPGSTMFNIYGPVEATIWVSRYRITSAADVGTDVSIGTPVPWTQIYILNDAHQVAPVGEVGEIAAAGEGVALCYLGNPEETEERFVALPIGEDGANVRVYLTGDFGSIDDQGLLRFHGRRDRQVKIQGVRVEPHEVERVVAALAGVQAVVALPIPVGAQRPEGLAVVYATGQSAEPHPDDVRRAVADALPPVFVPRVIRRFDVLPLNANGKVDQVRATDLLSSADSAAAGQHERARTPLMTLLVELEALTGVAPSVKSDVVDLGLTSISALKLIGRLRAIHGLELPMNEIFRRRTPEAIASWLTEQTMSV